MHKVEVYNEMAAQLSTLPNQVYFTYCQDLVYLDDFMELVKMNIIKYCVMDSENRKSPKKGEHYKASIRCS